MEIKRLVKCKNCGKEFLKIAFTINRWQGKCKACSRYQNYVINTSTEKEVKSKLQLFKERKARNKKNAYWSKPELRARILERNRKYQKSHPEKMKKHNKAWRDRNPAYTTYWRHHKKLISLKDMIANLKI